MTIDKEWVLSSGLLTPTSQTWGGATYIMIKDSKYNCEQIAAQLLVQGIEFRYPFFNHDDHVWIRRIP